MLREVTTQLDIPRKLFSKVPYSVVYVPLIDSGSTEASVDIQIFSGMPSENFKSAKHFVRKFINKKAAPLIVSSKKVWNLSEKDRCCDNSKRFHTNQFAVHA